MGTFDYYGCAYQDVNTKRLLKLIKNGQNIETKTEWKQRVGLIAITMHMILNIKNKEWFLLIVLMKMRDIV